MGTPSEPDRHPSDRPAPDRLTPDRRVPDHDAPVVDNSHRHAPVVDAESERRYVAATRTFFASRAATWNTKFGDDLPAYECAVVESGLPTGAVVLDIGCGTGRALPALRRAAGAGSTVIGLDLTPEMLDLASGQTDGPYPLLRADARRLPIGTARVDAIFAAGLVHHLPAPADGLTELARVTRRGGRLILFHPSGRAALAARHGHTLRDDEPMAYGPLTGLLTGSGWRLLRYDDAPHRFYALAERL